MHQNHIVGHIRRVVRLLGAIALRLAGRWVLNQMRSSMAASARMGVLGSRQRVSAIPIACHFHQRGVEQRAFQTEWFVKHCAAHNGQPFRDHGQWRPGADSTTMLVTPHVPHASVYQVQEDERPIISDILQLSVSSPLLCVLIVLHVAPETLIRTPCSSNQRRKKATYV